MGSGPTGYKAIPVSDEPAAQIDRLRYVLAQGVKDGLVVASFYQLFGRHRKD